MTKEVSTKKSKTETISERIEALEKSEELYNIHDLLDQLRIQSDSDCYWSVKEIAKYLDVSISTIRRNYICDPRFPKPVATSRRGAKRWLKSEVKKVLPLFSV